MHVNTKMVINRPRKQVWEYFSNPENLHTWIDSLKAYHHDSGEPGTIGSRGIYEFEEYGKTIELREEVLACKAPEEFSNTFRHEDYDMITNYTFFDKAGDKTEIICNTEYKFRSTMWQIFSEILKHKMQRRQDDDLRRLKLLVEM